MTKAEAKARVAEAAYLGDRIHYQVAVEGADRPLAISVNNVAEGFGLGTPVTLFWGEGPALILGP